jgi:hypothetical protein
MDDSKPVWTDTMWCLFKHGPTWDGNLPSKSERDDLVAKGWVEREDGWQWLTKEGMFEALQLGMGERKDSESNRWLIEN